MTTLQMQNKYNEVANEINSNGLWLFNEDGCGIHTPSVYEFVQTAIRDEWGFYEWLFDDEKLVSEDDLNEGQKEEVNEFIEFCATDNDQ